MHLQGIKYIDAKTKAVWHTSRLLIHACLLAIDKCNRIRVCIAEFNELVCAWRSIVYSFKFILPCTGFEVACGK